MTVLSSLPAVNYLTDTDPYHYTVDNRPLLNLANRDTVLATAIDAASISYTILAPGTGFSATLAPTSLNFVQLINPIGTLATGTIVMPAAPADGQMIKVASSQTITSLTVNPNSGQTIVAAPTTITSTTSFEYIYVLSLTTWFRTK